MVVYTKLIFLMMTLTRSIRKYYISKSAFQNIYTPAVVGWK